MSNAGIFPGKRATPARSASSVEIWWNSPQLSGNILLRLHTCRFYMFILGKARKQRGQSCFFYSCLQLSTGNDAKKKVWKELWNALQLLSEHKVKNWCQFVHLNLYASSVMVFRQCFVRVNRNIYLYGDWNFCGQAVPHVVPKTGCWKIAEMYCRKFTFITVDILSFNFVFLCNDY